MIYCDTPRTYNIIQPASNEFGGWSFLSPRLVPVNIAQVMVAVDGSDHSMKAAELGIRLAKLWNAQLYFIHVQEKDKIPNWFTKFAETEHIGKGDYFEDCPAEDYLARYSHEQRNLKFRFLAESTARGDAADQILRNAERKKVDLIVMGSHSLSELSRVVLGSVSTKVLSKAKCTCITVK